uniref:Ig-like domain-containing protein n=1 Tax=Tetranychus urticae TaxID=32264 RepID=T1K7F6_TETUR
MFFLLLNPTTCQSTWTRDNSTCPVQCKCSFNPSKWVNSTLRTVDCSLKGLKLSTYTRGDLNLPEHTQSLWLNGNRLNNLFYLSSFINPSNPDSLIELDLSHNSISSLGRSSYHHPFSTLTHLKYLNLSANGFKTLYPGVFRGLKRLERLEINSGSLMYLDEHAFDGLENLEQLYLQNNRIGSIFLELFQSIVNLHVLNLDGNSITHLTGGIFTSLNNLRHLSISRNSLHTLDDNSLVGLEMLETLDLSFNQLTKVPTIALQSLKRIKDVNLSGNRLTVLNTRDFVHLPVNRITVSYCKELTSIERMAFWDLPDLTQVNLTDNPKLRYIDNFAFTGTPRLNQVYLKNNCLPSLDSELVNNINNQKQHQGEPLTISLEANLLLCDCNLHYLHQCLNLGNPSKVLLINSDKLTCYHPANKTTLAIKDIDINAIPSECAPIIISTPPLSSNETIVLNGSIGDKVNLNCRAIGQPTPSITWILPSGDIFNESSSVGATSHVQLIKSTNQLRLNHLRLSDSGRYKCIAENRQGSVEVTFNLIVEHFKVQIWPLGISSTFVSVVWNGTSPLTSSLPQSFSPSEPSPLLASSLASPISSSVVSTLTSGSLPEYQILYKNEDDPSDRFEAISVGHYLRSYTIDHLEPRKRYKLCIAVRDSESHGSYIQLSCTLGFPGC